MEHIRRLPAHESSRLRAACALPRLSAIVEELVCNSLDAGATDIAIAMDASALSCSVRDDGCGITSDNMRLLGERNATSKLASLSELERGAPSTLGFRGEALHCLAAVSTLDICSCAQATPSQTTRIVLSTGERLSFGPSREARSIGTTVIAHDIYCNRPVARKQMQKQPGAALAEVEAARKRLAALCLAHPTVSMRLVDAARHTTVLNVPRSTSLHGSLRLLLGSGADTLPPLETFEFGYPYSDFLVVGHVAVPPSGLRTRECQYMYLNGRPLSRRSELHRIVDGVFARVHAALLPGKSTGPVSAPTVAFHAAYVLFLSCAPHRFDLTLEPDKQDAVWADGGRAAASAVLEALVAFFSTHLPHLQPPVLHRLGDTGGDGGAPRQHAGWAAEEAMSLGGWSAGMDARTSGQAARGPVSNGAALGRFPRRRAPGARATFTPATLITSSSLQLPDGAGVTCDVDEAWDDSMLGGMLEDDQIAIAPQPNPPTRTTNTLTLEVATAEPPVASAELRVDRDVLRGLVALGQVERKFIIASGANTLFIIDQHAADERVQLEQLTRQTTDAHGMPVAGGVASRQLRPVQRLAPTVHELTLLTRYSERTRAWGWVLREGAEGGIGLESVPAVQGVALGEPALHEYCASLDATGGGSALPPPAVRRVLASKACRRAVMFGTELSTSQCQRILDALARCDMPFQCAHGRPTIAPALAFHALPTDEQLEESAVP